MQCKSEPSPLAQGTLSEHCSHLVRPRFIPACAGNSFATLPSIFERPVHPRLRGELINRYKQQVRFNGSSPLTRGTRGRAQKRIAQCRFIPAYAGNSCCWGRTYNNRYGSSPLTRGTPKFNALSSDARRFIPAYAGNSCFHLHLPRYSTVHPRLRGELFSASSSVRPFAGSSPLTRGTL